jgi:hypothetical protein
MHIRTRTHTHTCTHTQFMGNVDGFLKSLINFDKDNTPENCVGVVSVDGSHCLQHSILEHNLLLCIFHSLRIFSHSVLHTCAKCNVRWSSRTHTHTHRHTHTNTHTNTHTHIHTHHAGLHTRTERGEEVGRTLEKGENDRTALCFVLFILLNSIMLDHLSGERAHEQPWVLQLFNA